MIPVVKILFLFPPPYKFKNSHIKSFCIVTPIVRSKYRHLVVTIVVCKNMYYSTTNYIKNYCCWRTLVVLEVIKYEISVVCHIQRFDFDCNLVVTRKVIVCEGWRFFFVCDLCSAVKRRKQKPTSKFSISVYGLYVSIYYSQGAPLIK